MINQIKSNNEINDTTYCNQMIKDPWLITSKIGGGSYGNIYLGEHNISKVKVAIKKFKELSENDGIPATVLRETISLQKLKHNNIIKILDIFSINYTIFEVQELMKMDLHEYILHKKTPITKDNIKVIIYQILLAVDYIHHNGFFHRDLKPQNILIDDDNDSVKITDFGSCRLYLNDNKNHAFTKNLMTPLYRAPEVMLGKSEYNKAVDLWSIGCIFAELILKRPLFDYETEIDIMQSVFKLFEVKFGSEIDLNKENGIVHKEKWIEMLQGFNDDDGIDLIGKLLMLNPSKRITAKDALKHKFFDPIPK